MMRQFLFLASLWLAATAIAAPVTPSQAQQAAIQFMQQYRAGVTVKSSPAMSAPRLMANGQKSTTKQSSYYIFNTAGDKGYVIVSGDDRTTPILGYIDNGSFDASKMPANMKAWLDNYAQEISMLDELELVSKGSAFTVPRPTRNSISPLITSHWDQGAPYWEKCPEFMDIDENGDTVGELAYTGCVATSMAQVMNYYKHPLYCSQDIPSYVVTFYMNE